MTNCYAAWSKKTLTFQQLEDLLAMWCLETEEEEEVFHRMARDLRQREVIVRLNQKKVEELLQTCKELQATQKILNCQVHDLCCDLRPLEDKICCLELLTCNTPFVDCRKFNLYSMFECLFVRINQLRSLAQDVAILLETQEVIRKITTILSLDEKFLGGLLKKIEFVECELLRILVAHEKFPHVPKVQLKPESLFSSP